MRFECFVSLKKSPNNTVMPQNSSVLIALVDRYNKYSQALFGVFLGNDKRQIVTGVKLT